MPQTIALLIHSLNGGGAERLMSQLATRWSSNHEVHLVTWSTADSDCYPLPECVQRRGLDMQRTSHSLLRGLAANLSRVGKLRRELKAIAPDLILSFSDQMNIVTLEAARSLNTPVWISEHSDPAQQRLSRLWEAWRSRTYPTCTGCTALTNEIAEYMQRWMDAKKLRVIPPAIQPPPVDENPMSLGDANKQTFLFVGRLSAEKRVDLLLDVWKMIQPELPDWQLVIAGDGDQRGQLQQQAAPLPSVHFLGWVANAWSLYPKADCFVLPSRYEGFPVALLEAMSQGRAAIATRCSSAIAELSVEPESLLTIAPESAAELARAMRQLAADHPRRGRLGEAARRVAQAYSWTQIGPRWDAILGASG